MPPRGAVPLRRQCPQCLSDVPAEATRCRSCSVRLPDGEAPETDPLDRHLAEPDVIGYTGSAVVMPIVNG